MAENDPQGGLIRLDCPFHARNPEQYKRCRACNGAGFPDLSRLKDHLKTVHSWTCPKCSFVFEGKASDEHAKQHPECKYGRNDAIEHMSEKQQEALKNLPRRCRGTDRGKQWRAIFTILFGKDVPTPPPYLPSLDQYRRIAEKPPLELVRATVTRLLNSGHCFPFYVDENSVGLCLGIVIPTLFDFVSENGLLPENNGLPPPQEEPLTHHHAGEHADYGMDHMVNIDDDATDLESWIWTQASSITADTWLGD